MKKLLWSIVAIGVVICLAGCSEHAPVEQIGFFSESDLEGYSLYVHNVSCSEVYEMRTVADSDFLEEILALSVNVKQFRPVISTDMTLGAEPEAYYVLKNEKEKYTFSFFEVENQLDIEFVHRENPIITVGKTTVEEENKYCEDWVWMCTMTAADYATLYEMVQTYTDGDIVK